MNVVRPSRAEVRQGTAHFARVAGKVVPKVEPAEVEAAVRADAERLFDEVAVPLAMQNDIAAGTRHFAGCVAHRDQVRGVVRDKPAEPILSSAEKAALYRDVAADMRAPPPNRSGAKIGEVRTFLGKRLQWNGKDWHVPGRATAAGR